MITTQSYNNLIAYRPVVVRKTFNDLFGCRYGKARVYTLAQSIAPLTPFYELVAEFSIDPRRTHPSGNALEFWVDVQNVVQTQYSKSILIQPFTFTRVGYQRVKVEIDFYDALGNILLTEIVEKDVYNQSALSNQSDMKAQFGLLTDRCTFKACWNKPFLLTFVGDDTNSNSIDIEAFDSSNTSIFFQNQAWGTTDYERGYNKIDISKLITNDYTVTVNNFAYVTITGTVAGQPISVRIDYDCCNCAYEQIHFLNRLGAYETFGFTFAKKQELQTKNDVAKKVLGWNLGNTPHNTEDRGAFNYIIDANETYTVESCLIENDCDADALKQLIYSNYTYIDSNEEQGRYIPIVILDSKWISYDSETEQRYLQLTFRLANDIITQVF
jgi:hypothetical protein